MIRGMALLVLENVCDWIHKYSYVWDTTVSSAGCNKALPDKCNVSLPSIHFMSGHVCSSCSFRATRASPSSRPQGDSNDNSNSILGFTGNHADGPLYTTCRSVNNIMLPYIFVDKGLIRKPACQNDKMRSVSTKTFQHK
jgi:hypothetical protein